MTVMPSTSSFLFRSAEVVLGTANRRSICSGVALAFVVWAMASFGAQSPVSAIMGLLVVVSGGTAEVFFELDRLCGRLHRSALNALGRVRLWICLQGSALLITLCALNAIDRA